MSFIKKFFFICLVPISFINSVVDLSSMSTQELYDFYDKKSSNLPSVFVRRAYGKQQFIMDFALHSENAEDIKKIIMHIIDRRYLKQPEFRSCFFIGPPHTLKATMAQAIAYKT